MPYIRQGAMKVSDHWVRSPLLNVNNACQTCHPWDEEELTARVHTIQDRTYQLRNIAIDAVLTLAHAIRTARGGPPATGAAPADAATAAPATDPRVLEAQRYHRRAQFLADFIEAENSMGFHADQEAARILALAINEARMGHLALMGLPVRAVGTTPGPRAAPPQAVTPAPRRNGDAR
jgi:nitrite reductase (cytochrome c-552)